MIFCQDFEQDSARWFFCFMRHILESLSDIQLTAKLVQDGFTHLSGTLAGTTAGRRGSAQPHPLRVFSGPVHVVSFLTTTAGSQSSYIHFSLVPQRTKKSQYSLRIGSELTQHHSCHTLVVKTVRGQPRLRGGETDPPPTAGTSKNG